MASEKKLASNQRYMAQLEDIKLRVPKGYRDVIKEYAAKQYGMSLNALIIKLLNDDMKKNGIESVVPTGVNEAKMK